MIVPVLRSLILMVCTASSFVVLGRAPGAVNLRTKDVETELVGSCKAGRDAKLRSAWLDRATA